MKMNDKTGARKDIWMARGRCDDDGGVVGGGPE